MKYTKGEWKAVEWNRGYGYNVFSDEGLIATVPSSERPHTMLETKANAYLISATRDMYRQLNTGKDSLVKALNAIRANLPDKAIDYIEGVIAGNEMAIAKAEGKNNE